MSEEQRIDRLERLYETLHHEMGLLSIYIPRLTDILIGYWGTSGKHRRAVLNDLHTIRDAIDEHFKTHYLDKKKGKSKYKEYVNE